MVDVVVVVDRAMIVSLPFQLPGQISMIRTCAASSCLASSPKASPSFSMLLHDFQCNIEKLRGAWGTMLSSCLCCLYCLYSYEYAYSFTHLFNALLTHNIRRIECTHSLQEGSPLAYIIFITLSHELAVNASRTIDNSQVHCVCTLHACICVSRPR